VIYNGPEPDAEKFACPVRWRQKRRKALSYPVAQKQTAAWQSMAAVKKSAVMLNLWYLP